jgi:hypothetical protein
MEMSSEAPTLAGGEFLRLQLPLLQHGLSYAGISQFLASQPIQDPADRQALLSLVASLLIDEIGLPKCDGSSKDPSYIRLRR